MLVAARVVEAADVVPARSVNHASSLTLRNNDIPVAPPAANAVDVTCAVVACAAAEA